MNRPPTACPVCGAAVPRGARACPECGADERSGWNEDAARYDGLDLPAAAFDDDPVRPARRRGLAWYWWLAGALLVVALVVLSVGGR
jgi:predicted nucleic acid-binding Zn ribbon protein